MSMTMATALSTKTANWGTATDPSEEQIVFEANPI
jgi:hypothetical protein